jgi:N-glycosylase/DNA lyase
MRSNPESLKTLFQSSLLTSEQGHIIIDVRLGKGYYECCEGFKQEEYTRKIRSGIMDMKILWTLPSRELDQIIVERLIELAKHDTDMAERVKKSFESMKREDMDETNLLRGQIERTQKRINRLDFLLENPDIALDVETAKKYANDLAELRPKLARLLKKQNARPDLDPGETIANFYFVLSHLPTEFHKQSTDVQQQIMSRLVKHVSITNISPHFFHLYIIWQDGVAMKPDVALLWRGKAVMDNEGWSEEEEMILRTSWPKGNQREIMRLLPTRTWTCIRQHANAIGVVRSKELKSGRKKVNMYQETMSYTDLEAAMQYVANGETKDTAYMCEIVNELAEMTRRGQIRAYWPIPIDIVGYSSFTSGEEGCST